MNERQPRAIIIDDNEGKTAQVRDRFIAAGGAVVATVTELSAVMSLKEDGRLHPDNVDALFLDQHLTPDGHEGTQILGYLAEKDLVRGDVNKPPQGAVGWSEPRPHRVVTVGMSSQADHAAQLGTYSKILGIGLVIDWRAPDLNIPAIFDEIRRLKPIV